MKDGEEHLISPAEPDAGGQATAAGVAEVTASIRRYQAEGRPGRALEELQSALRQYGLNETFQKLRWELGQAMLDRDAEEEKSASLRRVPASTGAGPGEPHAAAARARSGPVDLPLDGVAPGPAAPHGFGSQPGFPNRHARRRPGGRRRLLGVGLVVILAVSAGMLLTRLDFLRTPGAVDEPAPQVVEAVVLDPGSVALDAVPWAEILSIVPVRAEAPAAGGEPGEEVSVGAARFTPVVLELPPGTYRIRLRYPPVGGEQEVEVTVASGARSERRVTFEELDGKRYFEKVGW